MQDNRFSTDKIEEMIKRKITITSGASFNPNKPYSTHNRTKTSDVQRKPAQKKHKNDIVIMNMPPSNRIDFNQNDLEITTKKSLNQGSSQNRTPFFTNPQISSEIERFHSYMFCQSHLNKQNCHLNGNNSNLGIKKYSSVNIRFSNDGKGKGFSQNLQNSPSRVKQITNQNFILKSSSVPFIQFKPSFRQLLKRNTKSPTKMEIKLKKSEFNYQRAISTSCESRKKAFMKILNAFEENCMRKVYQNPQIQGLRSQQQPKRIVFKQKLSRELISRVKTSRKSPESKDRKQKDQEGCRPWSAGKKNQIKLQPTEDENPLQFYSINAKY